MVLSKATRNKIEKRSRDHGNMYTPGRGSAVAHVEKDATVVCLHSLLFFFIIIPEMSETPMPNMAEASYF